MYLYLHIVIWTTSHNPEVYITLMVLGLFQMVFFSKMTFSSVKESDVIGSEVYHSLTNFFMNHFDCLIRKNQFTRVICFRLELWTNYMKAHTFLLNCHQWLLDFKLYIFVLLVAYCFSQSPEPWDKYERLQLWRNNTILLITGQYETPCVTVTEQMPLA